VGLKFFKKLSQTKHLKLINTLSLALIPKAVKCVAWKGFLWYASFE